MNLELSLLSANTIRFLAADSIQKANSGHPGMPMGTADLAFVLWNNFLHFNPEKPQWFNRDRFVLSAGHGSMLLYSLLYLFGYDVTLEDLKSFRQWKSRTPGHPERGCLPGVECTTGPLGQGFGIGVGMSLASKIMADRFNTEDFKIFDCRIFGIVSDGDLMEGVASEAASFAGHLRLDNLIYLYDCNRITIEGSTDLAFSEDVKKRFEAYGWKVSVMDGHNHGEIFDTLSRASAFSNKPHLIIAHTHIAKGSPKLQDSEKSHGSPLGADEIKAAKKALNWPDVPDFHIPPEVKEYCNMRILELKNHYLDWEKTYIKWRDKYPEKAQLLDTFLKKQIPDTVESALLEKIPEGDKATRVISGETIQKIGSIVPFLLGGAADLEPSIKCHIKGAGPIRPGNFSGRNIHFGIREHGMGAILNGMALFGGLIPYGATFLVFTDYMKAAIRLAAIMEVQVIYLFTHDSVFLGEDGPTHQPVEHLGALRIIPNLRVFRPADATEVAISWLSALKRTEGPTALILTRQNVPPLNRDKSLPISAIEKGAYILDDSRKTTPDVIILATGSEVHLAQKTKKLLLEEQIDARVISVPCLEVFEEQDRAYKSSIIPDNFKSIVAIEASRTRDFDKYLGATGLFIGISTFGDSAPWEIIAENYGFTPEKIKAAILNWLRNM